MALSKCFIIHTSPADWERNYYKNQHASNDMAVANIVELIGSSDKSWEDAAQVAVDEAIKTIRGIHGIEVTDMTAKIDSSTGKIQEYRVCVKLSFGVER